MEHEQTTTPPPSKRARKARGGKKGERAKKAAKLDRRVLAGALGEALERRNGSKRGWRNGYAKVLRILAAYKESVLFEAAPRHKTGREVRFPVADTVVANMICDVFEPRRHK